MNRHVLSAREEFICGGAQDISSARRLPPTWWSRSHRLPKVGALHLDASWFSLLQEESSGYGKCTDTTSPSHQDFLLQCWAARSRGAKRVTEDGPRSSCACAVLDIKPRVVCLFGKCLITPWYSQSSYLFILRVRFLRLGLNLLCSPGKFWTCDSPAPVSKIHEITRFIHHKQLHQFSFPLFFFLKKYLFNAHTRCVWVWVPPTWRWGYLLGVSSLHALEFWGTISDHQAWESSVLLRPFVSSYPMFFAKMKSLPAFPDHIVRIQNDGLYAQSCL